MQNVACRTCMSKYEKGSQNVEETSTNETQSCDSLRETTAHAADTETDGATAAATAARMLHSPQLRLVRQRPHNLAENLSGQRVQHAQRD